MIRRPPRSTRPDTLFPYTTLFRSWVLRSGAPGRDLPERYGPRTTCYNRFARWRKAGVWDHLMDAITAAHDGAIQMIDSTSVRAHQQAATAKRGVQITVSVDHAAGPRPRSTRSEEHTSELQSLMRNSYAVFCLKKTKYHTLK